MSEYMRLFCYDIFISSGSCAMKPATKSFIACPVIGEIKSLQGLEPTRVWRLMMKLAPQ